MRWLLLLLVLLNILYHVWHRQQAPLRAQEVGPVEPYRAMGSRLDLVAERHSLPRPTPQVEQALAGDKCLLFGDFAQASMADAVVQRLLSRGYDARRESIEVGVGVDYWVYLPPMPSNQAAIRLLRELQSRNIDSYVITVGDLENGISLGIFSRMASAELMVGRLKEAGYGASIRELSRSHRQYWIQVRRVKDSGALERELARLLSEMGSPPVKRTMCKDIASSSEFE